MEENKALVLKTFQNSAEMLDAKAVAALTGIDKAEVTKLIAKLKKEGSLHSPKRCYYEITK
ncbi:MarR family transcriptional regulator [Lactococcus kimchii]|uniref:MarR family transcriptional regulator n=1 Tax=Lactococcus sp. S-13 TaxID=2507158 RepID=UPI001023587F|nr:MarR family transcriptional regulator [Lactococcus sp. S-13]RZI48411.1 MarR family transcriptional regulator [Lactococcus sp. S-13]